jgi:hypothetical protein
LVGSRQPNRQQQITSAGLRWGSVDSRSADVRPRSVGRCRVGTDECGRSNQTVVVYFSFPHAGSNRKDINLRGPENIPFTGSSVIIELRCSRKPRTDDHAPFLARQADRSPDPSKQSSSFRLRIRVNSSHGAASRIPRCRRSNSCRKRDIREHLGRLSPSCTRCERLWVAGCGADTSDEPTVLRAGSAKNSRQELKVTVIFTLPH